MVTAIPVSARISVINGKEKYVNNDISASAPSEELLSFAKAVNSLQYNAPADSFVLTVKHELKNE